MNNVQTAPLRYAVPFQGAPAEELSAKLAHLEARVLQQSDEIRLPVDPEMVLLPEMVKTV
jgi:hypothetical protein